MKKLSILTILILAFAFGINGQTTAPELLDFRIDAPASGSISPTFSAKASEAQSIMLFLKAGHRQGISAYYLVPSDSDSTEFALTQPLQSNLPVENWEVVNVIMISPDRVLSYLSKDELVSRGFPASIVIITPKWGKRVRVLIP